MGILRTEMDQNAAEKLGFETLVDMAYEIYGVLVLQVRISYFLQ